MSNAVLHYHKLNLVKKLWAVSSPFPKEEEGGVETVSCASMKFAFIHVLKSPFGSFYDQFFAQGTRYRPANAAAIQKTCSWD